MSSSEKLHSSNLLFSAPPTSEWKSQNFETSEINEQWTSELQLVVVNACTSGNWLFVLVIIFGSTDPIHDLKKLNIAQQETAEWGRNRENSFLSPTTRISLLASNFGLSPLSLDKNSLLSLFHCRLFCHGNVGKGRQTWLTKPHVPDV